MKFATIFTLFFNIVILSAFTNISGAESIQKSTNSVTVTSNGILLFSTIDGFLTAVDIDSGKVKWKFKEEPVLACSRDYQSGFVYFSNPRDGQLYSLEDGDLATLPFTIPQLVKASPSRSTDGILYAGSKKDVWFSINPETGAKMETLPPPSLNSFCPVSDPETVFIGRTEYKLSMLDTKNKDKKWNVTFTDYSSHLLPVDSEYPFQHFTFDGKIATFARDSGRLVWMEDYQGIIVNVYLLKKDGLHLLPNQAVGKELFEEITEDDVAPDLSWFEVISQSKSMFLSEDDIQRITMGRLRPALFLGETNNGLFAIPMIVDNASHSMPKLLGPRLIDGPIPTSMEINIEALERRPHLPRNLPLTMTTYKTVEGEYLLLGLHKYPRFLTRTKLQFTDPTHIPYLMSYPYLEYQDGQGNKFTKTCFKKGCGKNNLNEISGTPSWPRIEQQLSDDDRSLSDLLGEIWKNHPLFVMMLGMFSITLIFVTVYMCGRASVYPTNQVPSRETSHASQRSRAHSSDQSKKTWSQLIFRNGSKSSSSNPYFEEPDDDLPPGWRQIGKLQYDTNAVLGRGCEGTIVYKGKFDGREAAIKRVVIENFSFADREINILRESDTNPNVIRYFCSEADHSFRFIALELCECTLKDYVLNPGIQANYADFPKVDLLCQATKGLDYLHRNKIVHRDVKPQNILLSRDAGNRVRVLISDFGLCKKIPAGRASISRFSGLAGTEGWIAPEVYIDGASVTCMADVFSLGCLYFFVLTNGKHPFGDALRRQDNILKGEYNLGALTQPDTSFNIAAMNLIETMIQPKTKTRPTLKVVLTHPMFWSNERQLQFFMDVSDRIEKEDENNDVVQRLERYGARVTRNWHAEICNPLREDLRKFRSYRTHSIRDLLRALRNKKHHYRELPPDVKQSLGDIPNGYVYYWTSRFPRLLMHIYNAMICCAEESAFASYYPIEAHSFCNRRLEEELDSDFIVAGPTIPLKHTTSTPVLPGSPARQQRDATPENWRNGDKGPISANAAKKRKKKKRAQISVLSPTEESDDNLGPEGDAKEN